MAPTGTEPNKAPCATFPKEDSDGLQTRAIPRQVCQLLDTLWFPLRILPFLLLQMFPNIFNMPASFEPVLRFAVAYYILRTTLSFTGWIIDLHILNASLYFSGNCTILTWLQTAQPLLDSGIRRTSEPLRRRQLRGDDSHASCLPTTRHL